MTPLPSIHPSPFKCNHKRCIEEVSGWKNTWIPTRRIVCISQCHAAHFSWEAGAVSGAGIDMDIIYSKYHLSRDNQANVNVKQHRIFICVRLRFRMQSQSAKQLASHADTARHTSQGTVSQTQPASHSCI